MKEIKSPITYTLSSDQYRTIRETIVQVRSMRKMMIILLQTEIARSIATFALHLPIPLLKASEELHSAIMILWAISVLVIVGSVIRKAREIDFRGCIRVLDTVGRPSLPPSADSIPEGISALRLNDHDDTLTLGTPSSRGRMKCGSPDRSSQNLAIPSA